MAKKNKRVDRAAATRSLSRAAAAEANMRKQLESIRNAAGEAEARLENHARGIAARVRLSAGRQEQRALMAAYVKCKQDAARYRVARSVANAIISGDGE